jgi:hypothetical protein
MLDVMLRDAGFFRIKDIPVEIEVFETDVMVSWDAIDEFGQGQNVGEAMLEFAESFVELCTFLFASDHKLDERRQAIKQVITQYIVPRISKQQSA